MKLCVALDLPNKEGNLKLLKEISEFSIWVKVGFRSFIRDGKNLINEIKEINADFKIFLDLKLYDIPNTMADAASEIAKLDIDMFNIHASSGIIAMQTVMQRLSEFKKRPLVLAVTALTSFDEQNFSLIYNDNIEKSAKKFAKFSFEAGVDGVVCSAYESKMIKDITSKEFLTLTPGIRPFNENSNDQKRVADINFAKKELVDIIVVGRPIYKSKTPKKVVENILNEL